MIQRILIPRIIIDINRNGLQRGDLRREGVKERIVLSIRIYQKIIPKAPQFLCRGIVKGVWVDLSYCSRS